MKRELFFAATAAILLLASAGLAQNDFMIFPQLADGSFPDGTFYRSTLNVSPFFENANCNLILYGMDADFGTGRSTSFAFNVPLGGFLSSRTTATTALKTGYATLTCDAIVSGQMAYAFYSAAGQKLAEATVFPTSFESFVYELIVDGRDGAQLGIAIANNTDLPRNYALTLRDANGVDVNTGMMSVPARSNLPRFVNEILTPPPAPGETFILEVISEDLSDFSMIGLQFTGSVFSTIPVK